MKFRARTDRETDGQTCRQTNQIHKYFQLYCSMLQRPAYTLQELFLNIYIIYVSVNIVSLYKIVYIIS